MIHRSIVGGLERIVAYLIERWEGAFPFWYAPWQVVIVPIEGDQLQHAEVLNSDLLEHSIRSRVEDSDGSLGERVHKAQQRRVPIICILGQREVDQDSVSIRRRDGERFNDVARSKLINGLIKLNQERRLDLDFFEKSEVPNGV